MSNHCFFDTNVLLYLLSNDQQKADKAESLLQNGGKISVQVLNEMTHVMRRKFSMSWSEVTDVLGMITALCSVEDLTLNTHNKGRDLAERYGLSVYDSMIVAAALKAGCTLLYSEDMHHGLILEKQLTIYNPFK